MSTRQISWGARAREAAQSPPASSSLAALLGSVKLQLAALMTLAGTLNLWALSRNGWANQFYAAAVRSMSSSWHDFLYASMDRSGVMTVDKPPLALWVQSLSVRVFGYHPLSILVPQALIGVATVALVYDLVRRRFGKLGGFVAGLVLALTPITVAISRHNNPDALLILCCVAALWCALHALDAEPTSRRTRWLIAAGVCVGLGFETKMLVALVVVPGIALAWLWLAPSDGNPTHPRLHALRQLLAGGAAMLIVGGAWPLLVELTPAADRPWVSGTSDNTILSLIFEYNGLGRVDGQAGGVGGLQNNGGGNVFGGSTGPLRLLNSALGGQAGWLLGFALVSGLAILVSSRLRRADARSGWLIAVGGAFATTAVLFSFASGIFHPYYVSLLAPFIAALVGAGAAWLWRGGVHARIFAPLAVIAGVACELAVLHQYPGQLTWLVPVLGAFGLVAALVLAVHAGPRVRLAALGAVLVALLVAPATWAVDTLGHATNGTFPEGGPSSVLASAGGPGGGRGGARFGGPGRGRAGFGGGGGPGGPPGFGAAGRGLGHGGGGAIGAPIGGSVSSGVLAYVKQHGGGTIAVESQSNAASSIVEQDAEVAGIGGFSGRESDVSIAWLAQEVRAGKITWVLAEEEAAGGGFGAGGPRGETRTGSRKAMAAVRQACVAVTLTGAGNSGTSGASSTSSAGGGSTLYDCQGRAAALLGTQQSRS